MNNNENGKNGIFSFLKRIFSKWRKTENNAQEMLKDGSPPHLEHLLSKNGGLSISLLKDLSFREKILEAGQFFWNLGYQDGKLGQENTKIDGTSNVHAAFIQDELKSAYKGRESQLKTETTLKKQIHDDSKKDYEENATYNTHVQNDFRKNPRMFSRILAVFYLLVAMLLVFADIPLALQLTQLGFDLDLSINFPIQRLFFEPWQVFRDNWEVFILAFGIALCSVYIKIFYDEFLARPVETSVSQFKNLRNIDGEEEIKKIKWIHKFRIFIKFCVLCLTIFTIVTLGRFRFASIDLQEISTISSTQQGDFLGEFEKSVLNTNQNNDPEGKEKARINAEIKTGHKEIAALTFILITVLFPVIGGICASLGLNYWENSRELKTSKAMLNNSKAEYLTTAKSWHDATEESSNWESALKWCESTEFINHIKTIFSNYYVHGYNTGFIKPKKETSDLFLRVEDLRNKIVPREIADSFRVVK